MLNTKQIVKKGFLVIIFSLLLVLAISPLTGQKQKSGANDYVNSHIKLLSNNFFEPSLSEPTTNLHQVKQYVPMSEIYEVIKTHRNALSENATAQQKLQADLDIVSDIDDLLEIENPEEGGQTRKIVSISSALELYQFGNAQSINFDSPGGTNTYIFAHTINKILSLDYELLADIDYSTRKAQKFVPIGTEITILEGTFQNEIHFTFNGTFNGNGFEIINLYLAEYTYLRTTFEDTSGVTASIIVSTINNYAMFARIGESGVVKNFILRNPSYTLNAPDDSFDVFKFSYLVGENKGLVYNIGVIDRRVNAQNQDISGMTFTLDYPTNKMATAAGFVHTNIGTIKNCYFVSNNIIISSSRFRFSHIMPFVYANEVVTQELVNGELQDVVYEGTIEGCAFERGSGYPVVVLPSEYEELATPYSPSELKEGKSSGLEEDIIINDGETGDILKWNFYGADGYPQLIWLKYQDGAYLIENDFDFIYFSKLVNLNTPQNGNFFANHTYKLTHNINMINFKSFKTPRKEFAGVLKSIEEPEEPLSPDLPPENNLYIFNLTINEPYIVGNKYYLGLFSTLTGSVENINFFNNNINVTNSTDHYGKIFYVGGITGELRGEGSIRNVITDFDIDLGNKAIGLTYAGGVVGLASGTLSYVHNIGSIDGGLHDFEGKLLNAKFYVGGLVGTNQGPLTIEYSQNRGNVTGVGSSDNNYISPEDVLTYTGGIIGEIHNNNQSTSLIENTNRLVYLSNFGTVDANLFHGISRTNPIVLVLVHQFAGGIFGSVKGYGFKLNNGSEVHNGSFENNGLIKGQYVNTLTYLYAAGIGVANTSEELAQISYMSNQNGFDITNLNYQNHNRYIYYASTVVDNSEKGILLSRAYNTQDYTFGTSYFQSISGLTNPDTIRIAPFFSVVNDEPSTTKNKYPSKLLYVENKGDLSVGNISGSGPTIPINREIRISNITQATKVDYENVINSGDIKVLKINNTEDSGIYVAGISWILPYTWSKPGDNPKYKMYTMTNVVNDGNIYTAGINGNTTISSYNDSTNSFSGSFSTINNLYVAGLVNINVGEIINAFNYGNISSDLDENVATIEGTANSFVGGITTFNYNLIQDAGNSGNITYTNSNSNANARFSGETGNNTYNARYAGLVIVYEGGLTLGGISAAFGNFEGTLLKDYFDLNEIPSGIYAKILDTINNGDVFGKAKQFVRSGGILGLALSAELSAGTYGSTSSGSTEGPFGRGVVGSADPIGNCELSSGLNYGNIFAISQTIGEYNGSDGTSTGSGRSNSERPGIRSCAGGVVAYGLTKMIRMINYGVISATDTAGGVIGATFIMGNSTTTVNINTAVHYGRLKLADRVEFENINYDVVEDENGRTGLIIQFEDNDWYYPDNNNILFPSSSNLANYPNKKRGFGGFIGRLQRGYMGVMQSAEFKNVLNMDPNVDFIGRTDMYDLTNSRTYYRLHTSGEETSYYSARINDTTSYVVVGWFYRIQKRYAFHDANVTFRIERSRSGSYYVTEIKVNSEPYTASEEERLTKRVVNTSGSSVDNYAYRRTFKNGVLFSFDSINTNEAYLVSNYGLVENTHYNPNTSSTQYVTIENYTYTSANFFSSQDYGRASTPSTDNRVRYPVVYVVDDVTKLYNETYGEYIFLHKFPLMTENDPKYIYPVKQDAIADKLKDPTNPNFYGRYVLASQSGSRDGTALPANIDINNFYKLNETEFEYIDLENVSHDQKITFEGDAFAKKVRSEYFDMYQLKYNDKAEILPEDESVQTKIAQLVFYDPDNQSPILTRGVVDYSTTPRTITYQVSTSAFTSGTYKYEINQNVLSNKAIISKIDIDPSEWEDFKAAYQNRVNDIISEGTYKLSATGTVPPGTGNRTITFDIMVYSELSVMDENIFNDVDLYRERYQIRIEISSTALDTNVSFLINSTNTYNPANFSDNFSITGESRQLNPNGSLRALFTGTTGTVRELIPLNHMMTVHDVYLVDHPTQPTTTEKIDPRFYSLTIIPRNESNQFGFLIEFSDLIQSGYYRIEYSYYSNSAKRYIAIYKNSSTSHDIVDVNHDYFSNDLEGMVDSFERTSANSFTTYTEFGYIIPGVNRNSNLELSITTVELDGELSYVDNKYYELIFNNEIIATIRIAPFAILSEAYIMYNYNGEGKLQYILTYRIRNEAGTTINKTHTILERNLQPMEVYLNDNYQAAYSFTITREANLSEIAIDFRFNNNSLYEQINFNVFEFIQGVGYVDFEFDETEIYEGNHIDRFIFYITGLLDKGQKMYSFTLNREGEEYSLGEIEIEKLPGTSAYLLDVKFTLSDTETIYRYPQIKALDESGNILSQYDPRVYAEGIDYVDTISNGITSYRIFGEVSDIMLEDYSPRFFLPYGATIQRKDETTGLWTDDLYDDFTGNEMDETKIVQYRVISEDTNNRQEVHYFISIRDIKYNLTLRFKIYYEMPDGTVIDAASSESPIDKNVLLISMKNFILDNVYATTGPTVDDFPAGITEESFDNIDIQASLYYFIDDNENLIYRFGRVSTGAFNFNIITPRYTGPTTEDLTPGERYHYEMYIMHSSVTDWKINAYKLPPMNTVAEGYSGLYYFVFSPTADPITRTLAIVIKPTTQDKKWGLYDEYASWD